MIDKAALIAPLSSENPCGEDITYDPAFLELDTLILGKEESQFAEAVKPDWKAAHARCIELFQKSKNLQVAVNLCLTSLQIDGLPGLAAALDLLSELLSTHWDDLYPRLDPDDHLDPLERMNILSALCMPIGSYGDSFRLIERLGEVPLTRSPSFGRLTYSRIHAEAGQSEEPLPEPSQVEAAFRDTPQEELLANRDALRSSSASVAAINSFLGGVPGAEKAPNFEPLATVLKLLETEIVPHIEEEDPGSVEEDTAAASAPAGPGRPSAPGSIHSRADVIAALNKICDYYKRQEPSSPVPLLLDRARRLVDSSFLDIVTELAPDSVGQFRSATGTKPDEPST